MLDVLNSVVGTFVKVRISADRARSKAAAAAGFEFCLTHTCSPSRMEVHNLLPLFLEALVNLVAGTPRGLELLKLERLPSQRHRFFRTIRNHHQLHELLETSVFFVRYANEVNVAQLDWRGGRWSKLLRKEFGPLLQSLVFWLAKILLQDHDLVAVKM